MTFRDMSPSALNNALDYNEKIMIGKNMEIRRLKEEIERLTNIIIDLKSHLNEKK